MTGTNRSRSGQVLILFPALACSLFLGVIGYAVAGKASSGRDREITIRARKYGYDPEVLRANLGDTLRIRLVSEDVVHGFYLEGYGIDATVVPQRGEFQVIRRSDDGSKHREWQEELVIHADHEGKFRYRCSSTCGFLHPFMLGVLVVGPNRLLTGGIGASLGVLLAFFLVTLRRTKNR